MKRFILLVTAIITFQIVNAQYTEIINSKRPGFSESPYSIGTDVFQFETGMFYKTNNDENLLAIPKTYGGELFFRYGKFLEKLEFDAKITYQNDEIKNPFGNNYNEFGVSELAIGAKYLIYQKEYVDKSKEVRSWKRRNAFDKSRFIPSVGVYAGVHTNFLSEYYKDDAVSFKGAILLQNDFSDRLVLLTNLIADKITSDDNNYSYIVTMTYALSERWSYFIENQGIFKENDNEFHFGTGAAYLFSDNLQIDASVRTNFFEDYSFVYSSIGVAWRLDKHSDEIINKSSPLNQLTKKRKKRGNFFSRLFKKN
ncbi:transporter [Lutibacter sp.]|uniref:transporter n=1 Tax=Lutibacter sp. TaxID=1925666 RepID=UPI00356258B3